MTTNSTIALAAEADHAEWQAALHAYLAVKAEDDAFNPGWWEAWGACKAECAAVPHTTLRPDRHTGKREPVTTADRFFVALARETIAAVDAGTMYFEDIPELQDHLALCRDVVAAAAERDAAVEAIRGRYNMDWQDQWAEGLGESISAAQSVLMAIPSPDLATLRWKLDHILGMESEETVDAWSGSYVAQLRADIARLLPVEA